MTESWEMRQASTAIRLAHSRTTGGTWSIQTLEVEDWGEEYQVVSGEESLLVADTMDGSASDRHGNAAWITLLGPQTGELLAKWLDATAASLDRFRVNGLLSESDRAALALARRINGKSAG